jgi:hypothetical protein
MQARSLALVLIVGIVVGLVAAGLAAEIFESALTLVVLLSLLVLGVLVHALNSLISRRAAARGEEAPLSLGLCVVQPLDHRWQDIDADTAELARQRSPVSVDAVHLVSSRRRDAAATARRFGSSATMARRPTRSSPISGQPLKDGGPGSSWSWRGGACWADRVELDQVDPIPDWFRP